MDKPARLMVVAVQTHPEQPEAPPLLILDPVIVADRISSAGAFRPPPLLGDPLRPIGPHHSVPAPPPGETERRVVGQQPERFDLFRRVEQPDRPWWSYSVILAQAGIQRSGLWCQLPPCSGQGQALGPRFPHGTSPWAEGARGDGNWHSYRGPLRDVALTRFEPR